MKVRQRPYDRRVQVIARLFLAAGAVCHALAAGAEPAKLRANEGEVTAIYRDSGEIAIRHGPLPELGMDPMSMVFVVADPAMLRRVKKGDRIKFKAGLVEGRFGVLSIERMKK